MTNGEHYAEKLIDFACDGTSFAVGRDGRLARCDGSQCVNCQFRLPSDIFCSSHRREWVKQEYTPTIDWTKVPVDTKVLVKGWNEDDGSWCRRYFAKYKGGVVFTYPCGLTSWNCMGKPLTPWNEAKLADPEDIEKYQIKE